MYHTRDHLSLMFTDDCLISYTTTKTVVKNIRDILQDYYKVFEQLINYHKFMVQFSNKIQNDVKQVIWTFFRSSSLPLQETILVYQT